MQPKTVTAPQTTAAPSEEPVLRARGLVKTFGSGGRLVEALRDCDIVLRAGEITGIIGASGSGKSTLLHILSGLDRQTTGTIHIGGRRFEEIDSRERARWRAEHVGFVLQRENLIPSLSIRENVAAPMMLASSPRAAALKVAQEMLEAVGLAHRAHAWPAEVSWGEAQRAAVARACAGDRQIIFADEPTGSLDSASSDVVLEIFQTQARQSGAATLLVTHDPRAAAIADRVLRMADGRIVEEVR